MNGDANFALRLADEQSLYSRCCKKVEMFNGHHGVYMILEGLLPTIATEISARELTLSHVAVGLAW